MHLHLLDDLDPRQLPVIIKARDGCGAARGPVAAAKCVADAEAAAKVKAGGKDAGGKYAPAAAARGGSSKVNHKRSKHQRIHFIFKFVPSETRRLTAPNARGQALVALVLIVAQVAG